MILKSFFTVLLFGSLLLAIRSIVATDIQVEELTNGLANFSVDFYQQVAVSKSENIICSPFSTAIGLSFLLQAAGGTTFEELRNGLHLSGDKATIAKQYQEYLRMIEISVGKVELLMDNQIYIQQGVQVRRNFQELIKKPFFTGVEYVDFGNENETAKIINQFVEQKTNYSINEAVVPEMFNETTSAILVDAITLSDSVWIHAFPPGSQSYYEGPFFINDTAAYKIEYMMTRTRFWSHREVPGLNASALRMDYANSNLSLVIIKPHNRGGLAELEERLQSYNVSKVLDHMTYRKCVVRVPKFKVETEICLNRILKNLGMAKMFDSAAEFDDLLETKRQFFVENSIHKVRLTIDEKNIPERNPKDRRISFLTKEYSSFIDVDSPFVFYVWDRWTRTTIFSGHIVSFEGTLQKFNCTSKMFCEPNSSWLHPFNEESWVEP